MLEKLFKLKQNGTNVRTEIIAGTTTFLSIAYILAVNPNILGTVMDENGVFAATAIASAVATFVMAFFANYPIALSAGMGLNAYFAYTVCMHDLAGEAEPFAIALTAVFCEGIFFMLISIFKFREKIVNGIPKNLKYGITTGIGLFIALLGLKGAGIVVDDPSTFVTMGSFKTPQVVLAIVGFLLIVILSHYRVKGAILIGIIVTWVLGMVAELAGWYVVDPAAGLNSVFPEFTNGLHITGLANTAFKFNFGWALEHLPTFLTIWFSFLFVDLFDTVGTVVGVADKAGLLDEKGELPRVGRVFMADAVGTTVGACLGTSTVTSVVESSAGVADGGKTGLSSVFTGIWFLLALVFAPIFLAIPNFATAPALIYVGLLMFSSAKNITYDDAADTVGAYLAVLMMPLTYSIANGIMFGVMSWVIVKVFTKKAKEVNGVLWIVFCLFAVRIATLVIGI